MPVTVPPVPAEFEIEGTVQALNGEAARVEYQISGQAVIYGAEVKEGKFRFRAYEGLRLEIRATQQLGQNKWGASRTVEVIVVSGLPPLKLVIAPQP